ncbi:MAG: transporter, partial [Actinomycetota bacterium]|nr:transporter [Actinomycetota bacterium]
LSGLAQRTPLLRGLPREVGVLAAIAFCVALGFGIVAPALPVFARTFGVSAFLAGAVVSAFAFVRLIASPGAGALVNRIGERRVLAAGLAIVAVSSFAAAFAQTYTQLIIMRALGGFGSSMFTVSAMALLLRTAGPEQRGRASGAFQAGFLFGGVAGPAVGGIVVGISIRAPFIVYSVTLAAATAVCLIMLRDPAPHTDADIRRAEDAAGFPAGGLSADDLAAEASTAAEAPRDDGETPGLTDPAEDSTYRDGPTGGHDDSEPLGALPLSEALRNRAYWAALATNLGNGFSIFGLRSALVPLFVVEGLRQGAGVAGVGFLVAAATQAVLLLPGGRMADNRGRRPAMIIGGVASVAGMLLLAVSSQVWVFLVAMGIFGIAGAFLGPAPSAVVGDVTEGRPGGTVVAVFQMVSDFGAIIGPLAAGFVLDSAGFGAAFLVGAVIVGLGLVAAIMMPETLKKPSPADG